MKSVYSSKILNLGKNSKLGSVLTCPDFIPGTQLSALEKACVPGAGDSRTDLSGKELDSFVVMCLMVPWQTSLELKENTRTMSYQIENASEEIEIIKGS